MSSTSDGCHGAPLEPEEVEKWFDLDGRLVKEASMRKALFEVGVNPSCRRRLFKFLFGIYPMNATTRDQRTIDIENRAHYIALRKRWSTLDKTITFPDDDFLDQVWYMDYSDDEEDDSNSYRPLIKPLSNGNSTLLLPGDDISLGSSGTDCDPGKSTAKLTESRDSGNFTETSLETSNYVLCGSSVTNVCSLCGKILPIHHRDIQVSSFGDWKGSNQVNKSSRHSDPSTCNCDDSSKGGCHDNFLVNSSSHNNGSGSHDNGSHADISGNHGNISGNSIGGDGNGNGTLKKGSPPCSVSGCSCGLERRWSHAGVLDEEGYAMLEILDFPSKVFAARLSIDLDRSYPKAKRTILRDVCRTDRNYHFFSHKRNLRKVHRILMIFSLFHPEMGYAQGMNDILARFLVMTESEVDSYWLFKQYMERKKEDFLEETMMTKVGLVKKLIKEIDSELYHFFESSECQDYLFCHRWLLLDFKREFPLEDSIRIFEVLCSHYLELNSDKALVETDKVIAKEFELDGGEMRAKRSSLNLDFTFDLFVCVAILTMNSNVICQGTDAASVYGCLNSLSMKLNLKEVLSKAEELFYKYCRLAVIRGFNEVEL